MDGYKQRGKVSAWVIIAVLLAAVAYMGYAVITKKRATSAHTVDLPKTPDEAMAKIQEYADKNEMNAPGKTKAESYKNAAIKLGSDMLANTSGDEQAQTAVGMYFGYLFINTKTRVDYCRKLGVDITPFSNALERVNADDTEKARAVFHRVIAATEEQLYDQLRPTLEKTLEMDMNDIAKQKNAPMPDVCRIFADHGEAIAGRLALVKVQPVLHETLQTLK